MTLDVNSLDDNQKRILLGKLLDQRKIEKPPSPLSFAQERLYFLDQLIPNTPLYNIPSVLRLNASIDVVALDRALQEIVRRHDVLRTSFLAVDGRPLQQVNAIVELTVDVFDLRSLSPSQRDADLAKLMRQYAQTPFDLQQAPLVRAALARYDTERAYFLWTIHHIISDEWSAGVFIDELRQLYESFSRQQSNPLAPLPIQYGDYIRRQRDQLTGQKLENLLLYWKTRLDGAPDMLALPYDRPRPIQPSFQGGLVTRHLESETTSAFMKLAQSEGLTLFMALQAAFVVLLHRMTGQTDIVIGTPVANRSQTDIEKLIGFFVNTVVLRNDLSGNPTFRELFRRVREVTLSAFDHQELPFEKLVEEMRPTRSFTHNPIFQVMLVQNIPVAGSAAGVPTESSSDSDPENGMAKFDLTLFASLVGSDLIFGWEYSLDLFEEGTIRRFADQFNELLRQGVRLSDARLSELGVMTPEENEDWHALARGAVFTTQSPSVHESIFARAMTHGSQIALQSSEVTLTYDELIRQSCQVGARLRSIGLKAGTPVATLLSRSWQSPVATLAIWICGSPIVPLDIAYPRERLTYMLRNSGAQILITDSTLSDLALPDDCLALNLESKPFDEGGEVEYQPTGSCSDLCYILYTSGSTGQPKGVMMEHRALANLIEWQNQSEPYARRTLLFAPLSFDVSFQEVFSTLAAGGTLVIPDERSRRDFAELWQFIIDQRIQRIFLPYVALQALAHVAAHSGKRAPELELVVTAGEQLLISPTISHFFTELSSSELRNQYGPTETHVVTEHRLTGSPAGWSPRPPIGRPIANTSIYLLDDFGQPSPVGVPGEICIAGMALARGYWCAPQLTDERFREAPATISYRGRLYHTGDRGRWLIDGNLEFLDRVDEQVKIRGFRVEPAEARHVLLQHPDVAEAAVVARNHEPNETHLVAYVLPRSNREPSAAELKNWCGRYLPDYLVPSLVLFVDHIPLTPSGKIAVRQMPSSEKPNSDAGAIESVAILNHTEEQVLRIVRELLRNEVLNIDNDFFVSGGHSLLAMRLVSKLEREFNVNLTMQILFDNSCLRALSAYVDKCNNIQPESIDADLLLSQIEEMSDEDVEHRQSMSLDDNA